MMGLIMHRALDQAQQYILYPAPAGGITRYIVYNVSGFPLVC